MGGKKLLGQLEEDDRSGRWQVDVCMKFSKNEFIFFSV